MEGMNLLNNEIKRADRSVDPAKVSPLNRVAFATGLAQAAFGAAYAPPAHASFVDRTPEETKRLRASAVWSRP